MGISEQYNWSGKKILIAEDEEMNFMLLEETLFKTKADLLRATTGKQVVEVFYKNPDVALILMDVKMPEMSGYEAAKIIRQQSDVPIIAQTAFAMSGEESKSTEAGCNAYISKPIRISELLSLLSSFIDR